MQQRSYILGLSALSIAMLGSSQAFATFEKNVPWSGKYGGIAGITSGNISGSQSLFYNPAGLGADAGKSDVSVNFSPTWLTFKGPIGQPNVQLDGGTQFVPFGAITAAYGINEKWTVAAGFAAIGGSRSTYENIDFSWIPGANFEMKPTARADLNIIEGSIGTSYEVLPGLRLGAAWRATMVSGHFTLPTVTSVGGVPALFELDVKDISANRYNGFRVGGEYTSEDKTWGLGVDWRTPLDFNAKATESARIESAAGGPVTTLPSGDGHIGSSLPSRIGVGGFYAVSPAVKLLTDVVWLEYHRNQYLDISGPYAQQINLDWQNMWSFRLGGEYTGIENWALRAGYALTTRGGVPQHALAVTTAPGTAHGFTLGAGTRVFDNLDLDFAVEHTATAANGEPPATAGEYRTRAISLHTGATYHF